MTTPCGTTVAVHGPARQRAPRPHVRVARRSRVARARGTRDGQPVEVSRNYFGISRRSNAVCYLGEDVDTCASGGVAGHDGTWHAGESGARLGLMMPGAPLPGARSAQEVAPGLPLDRAEVVPVTDGIDLSAGRFTPALRVLETTPLEPAAREFKVYGRSVGLLVDGEQRLVRYGPRVDGGR